MNFKNVLAASVLVACVGTLVWGQAQEAPTVDEGVPPPGAPVPQAAPGVRGAARGGAAAGGARAGRGAAAAYVPTAEQRASIQAKMDQLFALIDDLKKAKADDKLIVDAESCGWIVHNIMRVPGGFIDQSYVNRCLSLLDDGLRRAGQIKAGTAQWPSLKGQVRRAYRSKVDGTAQPYSISIPANYDPAKPTPLYVYLHGRSQIDPDLAMGQAGGSDAPPAGGARGGGGGGGGGYIRVNAFGRANNSFRWMGETDVLEVIAAVQERYNIDPDRILLAGFSLGGAGSWQTGLHYPDMFCGLEIDAGVIGARTSMDGMSPADRAAQTTYGIMIGHALNVTNVPLVAYAGANDAQLASSKAIRKQLEGEGYHVNQESEFVAKGTDINAWFLANPGQAHSHATGATLALINGFNADNFKRGRVVPDHLKFVTFTTRYNRDFWVTIDGLKSHFNRADIDATRDAAKTNYTIKTSNISRLEITDAAKATQVAIDGDTLKVTPSNGSVMLAVNNGHWQVSKPETGLVKKHALQGPINDAFFDSFMCVTPTGTPFNALSAERAKAEQDRFYMLVARDYLGEARTKNDSAINEADIAANNLVLFGDPSSNAVIGKIAAKLPIKWTKDSIEMAGKTYSTADHVPVMIYPNPLNPEHYVVINTGLPQGGPGGGAALGDYAVLKVSKGENGAVGTIVEDGGVFDERWQVPAK